MTRSTTSKTKKKSGSTVKPKLKPAAKSPTPFQNRVYDTCRAIPVGKISTYGVISHILHSSPRAVGQALRCNPYAPEVPCHRIIASTLELGGFTGSWGISSASVQKKKAMLKKEKVDFTADGKLIDTRAVLTAAELADLIARK
jgi:methylated-DNA-[protein]-cysteine S-methyltransferase